jgi:hypothetical protein
MGFLPEILVYLVLDVIFVLYQVQYCYIIGLRLWWYSIMLCYAFD